MNADQPKPALVSVGANPTLLWGMTNEERVRRIATSYSLPAGLEAEGPVILTNLAFAFDPAWIGHLVGRPGTMVTRGSVPALAHVTSIDQRKQVARAMGEGKALPGGALEEIPAEAEGIFNEALRKRERPFVERLVPEAVPAIERAS